MVSEKRYLSNIQELTMTTCVLLGIDSLVREKVNIINQSDTILLCTQNLTWELANFVCRTQE